MQTLPERVWGPQPWPTLEGKLRACHALHSVRPVHVVASGLEPVVEKLREQPSDAPTGGH